MGRIEGLPERLRAARKGRGVTQAELAYSIDAEAQRVSDFERGLRTPSLAVFRRLCEELRVSADWLLDLEV